MTAENLAILFLGLIWPFIFQLIKGELGWSDTSAVWAALVTCYLVAFGAILATGGSLDPESLAARGAEIATLAWLLYQTVVKRVMPVKPPLRYD